MPCLALSSRIAEMALMDRVQKDMVEAMKAKDEARLSAIRMLKAALMKYKVDTMKEVDEAAGIQVLNQLLKQRRESADVFRKNGRDEMADKEEAEAHHNEFYVEYALECAAIEEMRSLSFGYFAAFPKAQSLTVNVIMPKGQSRFETSRTSSKIDLGGSM